MSSWLDMFRDTITCVHCKQHFTELLAAYRTSFPNMLATQHDFVIFTFRAHNAVNRRLNKPVHGDIEACMSILTNNVKNRSARDYRISYLNHITRHWRAFRDASGISSLRKIAEMNKIEREYFGPRDNNFELTLAADVVVLPQDTLERNSQQERPSRPALRPPAQGFRLTAGGLRIRR